MVASGPENAKRTSVSARIQQQFRRHEKRRKCAAVAYIVLSLAYLAWRASIINEESLTLSLMYYAAECMTATLGLLIILTSWNYHHREIKPAPAGLSVDILIPTYNEPYPLIRNTVLAAKNVEYPHQTYILDDGRRDDIRALAGELGVGYVTREGNRHAKAGNLNHGLKHCTGEFVMVFDADHIPMPHALHAVLGFFDDAAVAMVQTPQDYYNTDAFQYINSREGALWHDQSFFYAIGQSSRDGMNGTSCVGTGVIYRRSALEHIGGIPTQTVTEDIHTSLKFHKAGYEAVYLNEPIAYGEAAPDLREYYSTRQRWGHGNLHALQQENVLLAKGFTFRQRVAHISLGLIYLEGWQQLLIFMIPVGSLLFGMQPFDISLFNILVVLFFPLLAYLLLQETGCGLARFWPNEIYSMARWPVQILATMGAFGRSMPWRTTLKNIKAKVHWHLMAPQITVMLASVAALAYAVVRLQHGYETGPLSRLIGNLITGKKLFADVDMFAIMPKGYTLDLVVISGFWAGYNAIRAAAFIYKAVTCAHRSHTYFRFPIPFPVQTKEGSFGHIQRISEVWLECRLPDGCQPPAPGETLRLSIYLPAGELALEVIVDSFENNILQGPISWHGHAARDALVSALYSLDWQREITSRHAYFNTPIDSILSLFRLRRKTPTTQWRAVLLFSAAHGARPAFAMLGTRRDGNQTHHNLLTFAPLDAHVQYHAVDVADANEPTSYVRVLEEEAMATIMQRGLDGAVARRYHVQLLSVAKTAHTLKSVAA